MKLYDVRDTCTGVDRALAVEDNPRHRHILLNFRRHGLLEVSGLWEQILIPEMTVEEPRYRLMEGGRTHHFDGMAAVAGFYRDMTERGDNVFGALEEEVAVSDWGLFTEGVFAKVLPGSADELREDGADPDRYYQVSVITAFAWPYTGGRLLGEHVYEDHNSRTVVEVPADTFVTPAQARERLAPFLAQTPLETLVAGLALFR